MFHDMTRLPGPHVNRCTGAARCVGPSYHSAFAPHSTAGFEACTASNAIYQAGLLSSREASLSTRDYAGGHDSWFAFMTAVFIGPHSYHDMRRLTASSGCQQKNIVSETEHVGRPASSSKLRCLCSKKDELTNVAQLT